MNALASIVSSAVRSVQDPATSLREVGGFALPTSARAEAAAPAQPLVTARAQPLFPPAMSGADVVQGRRNDCYLLASIRGLIESPGGPQRIRDMVEANPDGSYTVTFASYQRRADGTPNPLPVTVSADEVARSGAKVPPSGAVYVKVLEAALTKLLGGSSYIRNSEEPNNGGRPFAALYFLTGQDYHWVPRSSLTEERALEMLRQAEARGSLVLTVNDPAQTSVGVRHVWTVTDVYQAGGDWFVHLGNPWGPETDLKRVPLDFFLRGFNGMWVQR